MRRSRTTLEPRCCFWPPLAKHTESADCKGSPVTGRGTATPTAAVSKRDGERAIPLSDRSPRASSLSLPSLSD
jgi:hypothetical protein